jgi:pilus assembly protein CpaD
MPTQNSTIASRLALLTSLILVAGCHPSDTTSAGWTDPVMPKESKVELVTLDHDVHFAKGTRTVAADEATGLSDFLRDNAVDDGDTATVDSPSGASSLAAARRVAVVAELKRNHIKAVQASATAAPSDSVRIHVSHAVVIAPRCPDWSKPEADNPANAPSSNYGCATEANLAQMVANPADLVRGRQTGPANGAVLARGGELYQSGNLAKTLSSSSGYSTSGLSGTSGPAASGTSGGGGGSGGGGSQ